MDYVLYLGRTPRYYYGWGEIRDTETVQIAVRAAITGHLVLSTIHTNDTASTVIRLIDMGGLNLT